MSQVRADDAVHTGDPGPGPAQGASCACCNTRAVAVHRGMDGRPGCSICRRISCPSWWRASPCCCCCGQCGWLGYATEA